MLSSIIRKRRALRQKAMAATAEVRLTAYILAAVPFVNVGALLLIQPDYLTPLVMDPRGHVILGIAAVLLGIGFSIIWWLARRITKI
jgi:tight adherence protein B